jgi:hypothetical protein
MEDGRVACVLGQAEGAPKSVTYCTSATAGKVSCCFVASSPSFCRNGLIIRHEGRHQDGKQASKQASSPGRLMLCWGVALGSRCQPLAGHYSPSCSTGCAGLGSREAQTPRPARHVCAHWTGHGTVPPSQADSTHHACVVPTHAPANDRLSKLRCGCFRWAGRVSLSPPSTC